MDPTKEPERQYYIAKLVEMSEIAIKLQYCIGVADGEKRLEFQLLASENAECIREACQTLKGLLE